MSVAVQVWLRCNRPSCFYLESLLEYTSCLSFTSSPTSVVIYLLDDHHSVWVLWNLNVVSTCASLVANDAEHFFMWFDGHLSWRLLSEMSEATSAT